MPTSVDRRTFVKLSLAAATAAGIPAVEARSNESLLVFFDGRYSDSRRFAESFWPGVESFDVALDVGQLWYSRLRLRVESRSVRMVGLTSYSDLLVLEGCAADARMRLKFEAVHDCRGAEDVTHLLKRGSEDSAFALATAGAEWPRVIARAMVEDEGLERLSPLRLTTRVVRAADHPGTLVSWLIG